MKSSLAVLAIFALSMAAAAQQKSAAARPDLYTTLADLEKTAQTAQIDIANLRTDKWGTGLKPGFMGKNSHAKEAEHTAVSLKRNLAGALPALIAEVRSSRGSVVTSFKLYDDLSVVCETLDSLVTATETYGKKEEYGPLAQDFSNLTRIRRSLSSYIEGKAAVLEGKGSVVASPTAPAPSHAPRQAAVAAAPAPKKPKTADDGAVQASSTTSAGTQGPKKIVIDDNVTEKKPVPKKATVQYSNL
ncbi:MAG TPA: hypothetical protein VF532_15615 [Candidatus Angelobacter sp.]